LGEISAPIEAVLIMPTGYGTCWGKEHLKKCQKEAGEDIDLETEEDLKDYAGISLEKPKKAKTKGNGV
jgi:hypothetical protein